MAEFFTDLFGVKYEGIVGSNPPFPIFEVPVQDKGNDDLMFRRAGLMGFKLGKPFFGYALVSSAR
jgi:hypothetical protein